MRTLDIPEMLIVLGVVAGVAWAVYNWAHSHVQR
jgi:hypothetical protein